LLVLLFLTSCVIPIPIGLFIKDIREEDPAHYTARLEPPARYDHPYKGHVVERVVPAAEVPSLCMPTGADPFGAACSLESQWHLLYCFTERWTGARFDVPSARNCSLQWLAGKSSSRWMTKRVLHRSLSSASGTSARVDEARRITGNSPSCRNCFGRPI
jgi:hypothetical protein